MTEAENAVAIVKEFLVASMIPDAERAATYMHPEVKITFTGGRAMAGAADIAQFNGARYKWVKKALGEFDAVQHDDYVVIYSNGTLYGEWPDGRPFADNRFLTVSKCAMAKLPGWTCGMTALSGFWRRTFPGKSRRRDKKSACIRRPMVFRFACTAVATA